MAKGYVQIFGKRKAVKFRKYADDLVMDFARCDNRDIQALLLSARDSLKRLAELCDPPDPFDGL